MDLTPFTQTDLIKFFILDPITGDPTDIEVEAYGTDTKHYNEMSAKIAKMEELSQEDKILASIVLMIKSWCNVGFDGVDSLELNLENGLKLFKAVPVIAKQIEIKIYSPVNFMIGKG